MAQGSLFSEETKVCTVSELTRQIKFLLEEGFPLVWVCGEIGSLKQASSGHIYFNLKDDEAQIRAVIWRGKAQRLRYPLKDGLEIVARGALNVYPPRGDYSLVIEELQPRGLGAQDLLLRQLREKLSRLGFFAVERKKPLPRFPGRIALVTSPSGAAVRDMLEILGRRWPLAQVLICPVRVQGEGAAQDIALAIGKANQVDGVEVLILGRGGGSSEDLAAFNEEIVAQAIFDSRVPVVSAVGHEIDVTIADLVADRRALTPSEAAELVTPDREQLLAGLHSWIQRMREVLGRRVDQGRKSLQGLAERRVLSRPLQRIRDGERQLDDWEARLKRAIHQGLVQAREKLRSRAAQLEALSPLNVLARGYSLTRKESDRAMVRRPEQVQAGERLVTLLEQGGIISRVEETLSGETLEKTGFLPAPPRRD